MVQRTAKSTKQQKPSTISFETEDQLHVAVRQYLELAIAPPGIASAMGVIWWSNETRNAKSVIEGANRKARGVVAGIPDIFIYVCDPPASSMGCLIPIELKVRKPKLSKDQETRHSELAKVGMSPIVCLSVASVAAALSLFRVPHRKVSI